MCCSIEGAEAPRLFGQGCFELLQRLRRLFHFQEHLAQQLARWGQRPRSYRTFLSGIFQFRCRLHLPERFCFPTFSERSPCPDRKLLDFHLQGPVVFACIQQSFANLLQGDHRRARSLCSLQARCA